MIPIQTIPNAPKIQYPTHQLIPMIPHPHPSPQRQGLAAATLRNANEVMSVAQNGPALGLEDLELQWRCSGIFLGILMLQALGINIHRCGDTI